MTINRETYTELIHSMMVAYVSEQLTMTQISAVLFACAQPTTTEEVVDKTKDLRDALTDWPESAKGQLICIENVQLTFQCQNIHGPCEKGEHLVQMTRVIGSQNWRPEDVRSNLDFNQTLRDVVIGTHPEGRIIEHHGHANSLVGEFQRLFLDKAPDIEREVKDFREELDALFPSNQPTEKGGNDGESP